MIDWKCGIIRGMGGRLVDVVKLCQAFEALMIKRVRVFGNKFFEGAQLVTG